MIRSSSFERHKQREREGARGGGGNGRSDGPSRDAQRADRPDN